MALSSLLTFATPSNFPVLVTSRTAFLELDLSSRKSLQTQTLEGMMDRRVSSSCLCVISIYSRLGHLSQLRWRVPATPSCTTQFDQLVREAEAQPSPSSEATQWKEGSCFTPV